MSEISDPSDNFNPEPRWLQRQFDQCGEVDFRKLREQNADLQRQLQSANERIAELDTKVGGQRIYIKSMQDGTEELEKQIEALRSALQAMFRAADEVAAEFIQNKRAANWGMINDAYLEANMALQQPQPQLHDTGTEPK